MASSALGGDRGYANYVLACIALKEKQFPGAVKHLGDSTKAGFVPALTLLASLMLEPSNSTAETRISAVKALRSARAAGHRPAEVILSRAYLRGRQGFFGRFLGLCLLPVAMFRLAVAIKYHTFSIGAFHYANRSKPIFAEVSSSLKKNRGGAAFSNTLRFTHAAAAVLAAAMLFIQPGRSAPGWVVLAIWPYGLSYLFASSNNARSLIGALVQTLLLCTITAYVCSAYAGQLLDFNLSGWMIGVITLLQAFLLVLSCAIGAAAAKQAEHIDEPVRSYRNPILVALVVSGFIAAGSVFARPDHWRADYLHHRGFHLVGEVLLSILPYVAVSLFLWRFPTSDRWKPWIFLVFVIIGTVLAVINNLGLGAVQPGYLSVEFFVWWQFGGFVAAATWASDRYEW